MSWNGLHKFQVLIFGITRTPFWTKASRLHMIDHWRETTSEQIWQVEKGLALIVFDNNFHKKRFCIKTNMKLDFLRMFGNSLLIYLLSKKFMKCISYWIKLNRCLQLVFGAHFLNILPKKIFVMWYSINWPCFKIRPSLFTSQDSKWFAFLNFSLRTHDEVINFKIYLQSSFPVNLAMGDEGGKKFECLDNERSLFLKIKSIFDDF